MAKHPHAELIKQMVDDDSLRVTYGIEDTTYEAMSVLVYPEYDWRLVPPKPKTITIVANGKEYVLPEPMRVAPAMDVKYFVPDFTDVNYYIWRGYKSELCWLSVGICHATREAAQAWVDAMADIRGAK